MAREARLRRRHGTAFDRWDRDGIVAPCLAPRAEAACRRGKGRPSQARTFLPRTPSNPLPRYCPAEAWGVAWSGFAISRCYAPNIYMTPPPESRIIAWGKGVGLDNILPFPVLPSSRGTFFV